MEIFAYILILLSIFLLTKLLVRRHDNHLLPPSPPSLPIIGHLHLLNNPLYLELQQLSSRYGDIIFLRFGVRPILVVSSPSLVEECFTKNDIAFASRPPTMVADYIAYNYTALGFAPYGHVWRTLRRLYVVEFFSSKGLKKYSAIREQEVHNLVRKLHNLSSQGVLRVEMKSLFSVLTFNITMRMISGKRLVEWEMGDRPVGLKILNEFKDTFLPRMSMTMCDFLPFLRWVGYKGLEQSISKLQRKRDGVLQGLVDEVRGRKRAAGDDDDDAMVINTLLSLQELDPEFYTDDVIKGIVMIMFSAGTDTTGVTMEWAMSLLLNHPEKLQKARDEINSHVDQGRLIDENDVHKLQYLRCIINETLRLYPPTPLLLPHFAHEECTVVGYKIPQGTTLLVNAWAMQRDPKFWEDPAEFRPERFEGIEEGREGFKFVPFGMGRRICPGVPMGMRLTSLALGLIIQCFDWERVGNENVDMEQSFGLTMSKSEALEAVCNPRPDVVHLLSGL